MWTGGLPTIQGGLSHLPGVPPRHVNRPLFYNSKKNVLIVAELPLLRHIVSS